MLSNESGDMNLRRIHRNRLRAFERELVMHILHRVWSVGWHKMVMLGKFVLIILGTAPAKFRHVLFTKNMSTSLRLVTWNVYYTSTCTCTIRWVKGVQTFSCHIFDHQLETNRGNSQLLKIQPFKDLNPLPTNF